MPRTADPVPRSATVAAVALLALLPFAGLAVGAPSARAQGEDGSSPPAVEDIDPGEVPGGASRATPADPSTGAPATPDGDSPTTTGGTDTGAKGADPAALAEALKRLQGADTNDLWSVADAVILPVESTWNAKTGSYSARGALAARVNAEMLLVHSYAALDGHRGATNVPERIAPLVRLLTNTFYVPTLQGQKVDVPRDGHSVTTHAPGFTGLPGRLTTMHQSLDAVVLRALAAAWRARDVAKLSPEVRSLIQDRVRRVAMGTFWRSPSRLLNQVNWNADVYAAYTTVTGDPTLLRTDYRRELSWFAEHARTVAYPGGSSNLGSGGSFHYLPNRPGSYLANKTDTAEYANITMGAMAYYDQARKLGMVPLSKTDLDVLRPWSTRVLRGDWTQAGYLNWDTGKGLQRLHLTQYWILALRGFAAGLGGSESASLMPDQRRTATWMTRRAVALYQRRAAEAKSVVLPASAYGMTGSSLIDDTFDGLTGTARFASTLAELTTSGLGPGTRTRTVQDGYAHDSDIGRLALTTERYSTVVQKPWSPLRTGGLEPSRLFDGTARALTNVGGRGAGTLGLRLRTSGGRTILDTESGRRGARRGALVVPDGMRNTSGPMERPIETRQTDATDGLDLEVRHQFTASAIRTTYRIDNRRSSPVVAQLRFPTYGGKQGGSLVVGKKLTDADLRRTIIVRAPSGGVYRVTLTKLPKGATGTVVAVPGQRANPLAGPQLTVSVRVPKGPIELQRIVSIPTVKQPG